MTEDEMAGCADYGLVEHAEYLRKQDAKRKRSQRGKILCLCPWCGEEFWANTGTRGKPRKWHKEACRIGMWRLAKSDANVTDNPPP